ncbi:fbxl16, putative [Schistosoma mansoni]|uniref:Fbxl16, putative n=3 Tax=Schistosoma mansoni TaxID=6183 RepID=A0A3Q0KTA9_SCHMA|nr:fbxl16, putative [Schistosoma mansoni]|eukprot:XP_018644419.1 fbxl16, putative [Schistosoma mansoni]
MTSFAKACIDFSNNLKNLRFTKSNATTTSSTVTVNNSTATMTKSSVVLNFQSDTIKNSVTNEYIISVTNRIVANNSKTNNHHSNVNSTEEKHRNEKNHKNSEHFTDDKCTICNKLFPIPNNISASDASNTNNNTTSINSTNLGGRISDEKEDSSVLGKSMVVKHSEINSLENPTISPNTTAMTQNRKNIIPNGSVNSDSLKNMISNYSDYRLSNSKISNSLPSSPVPRHSFTMKNKPSSEIRQDSNTADNRRAHSNINSLTDSPFTFKATLSPTMTHRLAILARNCKNSIVSNGNSISGSDSTGFTYNRYSNNSISSSSPLSSHRGTTVAAIKQRLVNQGLRINLNIPVKKLSCTRYRDYVRRQKRGCPHTIESLWLNKNFMNNIFAYLTGTELIHYSIVCRTWYEFMCLNGFQNKLCFVLNIKKLIKEIENSHEDSKSNQHTDYKDPIIISNHSDHIPLPNDLLYSYLEDSIRIRIVSAINRHLETIKIVQLVERFSSILYNILEMLLSPNHNVIMTSLSQSSTVESYFPQINTTVANTLTKTKTFNNRILLTSNESCSTWINDTDKDNKSVFKTNDFINSFQKQVKKQQQQNGFIQDNSVITVNHSIQNKLPSNTDSPSTPSDTWTFKRTSGSKNSISSNLSSLENVNSNSSYTHKFTHIIFKSCSIPDQSLSRLINLFPSIKQLEFECCNDFTELAFWSCLLPSIEYLTVFDCINVSDESMNAIGHLLPELKCFKFQAYHITDAALSYFSTKQRINMHTMELTQCMDVTNQGIMTLAYTLNNLQVLSLSGCSKLTDDGLDVICENLKRLISLNLSWCSKITDSGLECVACDLVLLKKLLLDRCTELTDLGISHLATMSNLQHLSVRWCINLSDGSIPHLLSTTGLSYLCLSGCKRISEDGLCTLARHPRLNYLELAHLPAATQPVKLYLNKNLPCCKLLC